MERDVVEHDGRGAVDDVAKGGKVVVGTGADAEGQRRGRFAVCAAEEIRTKTDMLKKAKEGGEWMVGWEKRLDQKMDVEGEAFDESAVVVTASAEVVLNVGWTVVVNTWAVKNPTSSVGRRINGVEPDGGLGNKVFV